MSHDVYKVILEIIIKSESLLTNSQTDPDFGQLGSLVSIFPTSWRNDGILWFAELFLSLRLTKTDV